VQIDADRAVNITSVGPGTAGLRLAGVGVTHRAHHPACTANQMVTLGRTPRAAELCFQAVADGNWLAHVWLPWMKTTTQHPLTSACSS
jgi:hypothetical protein